MYTMNKEKRKRVVLSIQQKLEIIKQFEDGKSAKTLSQDYGIGDQTVRDLVKQKDKFLKFACSSDSSSGMKKRKTMKKSSFEDLDTAMLEWFNNQRAQGNPVNGPICAEKAKFYFAALGLEGSFDASSGWLTRFKNRHGIRELDIQGERLSGDERAAEDFCDDFNRFVLDENLVPEQIYNADESGLYWKCLPSKTLAAESEKSAAGHKVSKDRITIMCAANATGSHKLDLLVIGKAKKPRSFKGTRAVNMPVSYYNSKKGWMTRDIFSEWFHKKFCPQVREFMKSKGLPQKAVLLLDNAPSHPDESFLKSDDGQIFVKYLPPNVTALIQPMDQGVIACIKRNYRSSILKKLIDEESDLKTFVKELTVLDAIYESAAAWGLVKPTTMSKSWKKIFSDISQDGDSFKGFEENTPTAADLAAMANSVEGGREVDEADINEWFDIDCNLPAFENLTDDEILMRAQGIEEQAGSDSDCEGGESAAAEPKVTHSTALSYAEGLIDYLEGQEDALLCDKLMLRKIRASIIKKQAHVKKQKSLKDYFSKV